MMIPAAIVGNVAALSAAAGATPTEVTLYSDGTYDDTLEISSAVAASVLSATTADYAVGAGIFYVGWYLYGGTDYYSDLSYLAIDTSSIPDGATINSAELRMTRSSVGGSSGSSMEARVGGSRGGAPVEADWLTPAQFAALPLAGTLAFNSGTGVVTFAPDSGFKDHVNKTGLTFLVIGTSLWATEGTPTEDGYTVFEHGGALTEADRPHLVINYTE